MGAAYFYHLTRQPLEVTLPMLLERSLERGWRVVLRGADKARMDQLDHQLWQGPDESFLPHGVAGGAHDADQPVLLTWDAAQMVNDPACLMSIDGASVEPADVTRLERVCILFDGHSQAQLTTARGQWKALTAAGCAAQYWSEESGRWVKKAES